MKRIQELLLSHFDKQKLIFVSRITILFLFLVLAINLLGITYSRYEAESPATGEAQVAYFVVDPGQINGSISLDGLVPSNNTYEYNIDVSNYKTVDSYDIRTNVNLTYNISFETTTNLPLTIEIYKDGGTTNLASTALVYQDQDCVYYKRYVLPTKYSFSYSANQTHRYTIKIRFPIAYKNSPAAYSGAIDLLSVIIDAEQTTNRTVISNSDYQTPTDYSAICNAEEED